MNTPIRIIATLLIVAFAAWCGWWIGVIDERRKLPSWLKFVVEMMFGIIGGLAIGLLWL